MQTLSNQEARQLSLASLGVNRGLKTIDQVIETLNLELQKRIMEATSVPNDLVFTAPLPGDKGVKKTYE